MKKTGILIEADKGIVKPSLFGVITYLHQLGLTLYGLAPGMDAGSAAEQLAGLGMDKIIIVKEDEHLGMNPQHIAAGLAQAVVQAGITHLFGLSSARGRQILARTASILGAPLMLDCTRVDLERHRVETTRYSGKTRAIVEFSGDRSVFGMRPNFFKPPAREKGPAPEVIAFSPDPVDTTGICFKRTLASQQNSVDLTEADVILSGGRGMKTKENFSLLHACAEHLNAAVGASRVAVDEGWVPYAMQVGQTGVKVNPKVYIAWGISGSVQHFAGMKTAGIIIAVNTDENAPIMSKCDYYAVGDLFEIIDALTQKLEAGSFGG